jgi:hypothetical protein
MRGKVSIDPAVRLSMEPISVVQALSPAENSAPTSGRVVSASGQEMDQLIAATKEEAASVGAKVDIKA